MKSVEGEFRNSYTDWHCVTLKVAVNGVCVISRHNETNSCIENLEFRNCVAWKKKLAHKFLQMAAINNDDANWNIAVLRYDESYSAKTAGKTTTKYNETVAPLTVFSVYCLLGCTKCRVKLVKQ